MDFAEEAGLILCKPFLEFVWLKHAFGSRLANPHADVILRQIHSDVICDAQEVKDGQREGDCLVTQQPNLSLGVRTADCVPILLAHRQTRAVAAVHAGWRGTSARIAFQAVQRLLKYGGEASDLCASIGPSIRACCYQVSPEVASRFAPWPSSISYPSGPKPHIDLATANVLQLTEAGVPPEWIFDSQLCTSCRFDLFFSFRRDPANPGRMLSVIATV